LIRNYGGHVPQIAATAYVDRQAVVIGDVVIGEYTSIWPCTVLRGDMDSIRIGARCSIQDGSVVHVQANEYEAHVGDDVTVGHRVILHGCTVGSRCLIGMGSIILNGAKIGDGCIIAAGALIPERMEIPPGSLVMGAPGKVRRQVNPDDLAKMREGVQSYVDLIPIYKAEQSK
jgi:carbonic anhydrase/acetyltransferase-like protein (isoleucine patch superfamily)